MMNNAVNRQEQGGLEGEEGGGVIGEGEGGEVECMGGGCRSVQSWTQGRNSVQ